MPRFLIALALAWTLVFASRECLAQVDETIINMAPVNVPTQAPWYVRYAPASPSQRDRPRREYRWRAIVAGTVIQAIAHAPLIPWAVELMSRNHSGDQAMGVVMLLQGIGPLIATPMMLESGLSSSGSAAAVLVFDGIVQGVGTAFVVMGLLIPPGIRRHRRHRWSVVPFAPNARVGMTVGFGWE